MDTIESRPFRLAHPADPRRVIRGRVEGPRGFENARPALPHVILLHGFKGFMDWGFFPATARRIAERGMVAVRYNSSGSGVGEDPGAFGDPEAFARDTVSRQIEDLESVRDWISSCSTRGVDPGRTALLGHSRGGAIAIVHAAERGDCRSVVAWAPVASFDRFDEPTKRAWRSAGHLPVINARTGDVLRLDVAALEDLEHHRARLDVPAAAGRLKARLLLVHGSADLTVPCSETDEIAAAARAGACRAIRVEGAGHTFGAVHPMESEPEAWREIVAASVEWIEEAWAG